MGTELQTETLDGLLASALESGIDRIGQLHLSREGEEYRICHIEDRGRNDLQEYTTASAALEIVLYDDAGIYRPLKTAPNLKHGWLLRLAGFRELRYALDYLYPAALGNWRALLAGKLLPVSLRETVNRQTGMYRISGKITDEQGQFLVETLCRPGCLRQILWAIPPDVPHPPFSPKPGEIPLLCGEACNIFVACARKVVKGIPLDQVD